MINKVVSKVVAGDGNLPQDEPRAIRAPSMAKSQPIHIGTGSTALRTYYNISRLCFELILNEAV